MSKDTYAVVLDDQTLVFDDDEEINGSHATDSVKVSNLRGVIIANKTFTGYPSENDIDMVRGGSACIGPNVHLSHPGSANIAVKGGFDGLFVTGRFGTLEWGQYSNYDRWFALPKSKNLMFSKNAVGKVTVWYGEVPDHVPATVTVTVIPFPVVWFYFLFRSICQSIGLP